MQSLPSGRVSRSPLGAGRIVPVYFSPEAICLIEKFARKQKSSKSQAATRLVEAGDPKVAEFLQQKEIIIANLQYEIAELRSRLPDREPQRGYEHVVASMHPNIRREVEAFMKGT